MNSIAEKYIRQEALPFIFCPGCGHGIVGKLIAELIDEMGLQDNGIMVWPIGCPITA